MTDSNLATQIDDTRLETLRNDMRRYLCPDENEAVEEVLGRIDLSDADNKAITQKARDLVQGVRDARRKFGGLDNFLQEFGLSTKEGIALMCLAEALLRIPDSSTANKLIRDKIGTADWDKHMGKGEDLFVNASTWALMLTGKVVGDENVWGGEEETGGNILRKMVGKMGEPVIRQAMLHSMRILGRQFVMGRSIKEALDRAKEFEKQGYRYSYDMLGEAARTADDAERYFNAYESAIDVIGKSVSGKGMDPVGAPGISIKLSALHPRFEITQADRCVPILTERLMALAEKCAGYGIGLTVDAEEARRLDVSLDIISSVYLDKKLGDWNGFGLAVQAYQKRAPRLVDWLCTLAEDCRRQLMVRLVKGAYWDSEIKVAQENGFDGYPVYTRKAATDSCYLACAQTLLQNRKNIYPMMATHNAHTAAAIMHMAGDFDGYEFQRLHGMGEPLYHQIVGDAPVRVYAPVGSHEDLLPYLVRRLLENGANSSFVNRIQDDAIPLDDIISDPVDYIEKQESKPHPRIPLPLDMYGKDRVNARGLDLSDPTATGPVLEKARAFAEQSHIAAPIIGGKESKGKDAPVYNPSDTTIKVGRVIEAGDDDIENALTKTTAAFHSWNRTPADERARCLERFADLLEENTAEIIGLCAAEAGKTINDGIAEVREAVDFCRYYAIEGRKHFSGPHTLPGPTGEANSIENTGRGVFLCISPWNFPLAIFTGQITAALMAGNCVIAKPAEQTPLIASMAVRLMLKAGIPEDVIALLPGDGARVGAKLVADPRVTGVAFTGSTETARLINETLAKREGPIAPLIAETGGQNAMIVDSSALPEQVVDDTIRSAFGSAGQRCSALRVLFLQDGIADKIITMLKGAMKELRITDPLRLTTDIGPLIDQEALQTLEAHAKRMEKEAKPVAIAPLGQNCDNGTFFAPRAVEIDSIDVLEREVFGPFLHIVRYKPDQLDDVIEQINNSGYGLTLGVHTRIEHVWQRIARRARCGNIYINRNIIGAIVGVQPFGGMGLSGTGPKAGGPQYLHAFATEKSLSVNTTASGGNTTLVSLSED